MSQVDRNSAVGHPELVLDRSTAVRLPSIWLRFALLLLLSLLLAVGFTRWQKTSADSLSLVPPLPQDELIQVYFNHSPAAVYTEPYRQQTRQGDDLEQVIVDAIATANRSIEVAVHELRLPKVAQALRSRRQAGVSVRVIVENTYSRDWSSLSAAEVAALDDRARSKYDETIRFVDQNQDGQVSVEEAAETEAMAIFRSAGIPVIDDTADGSKGSGLMHHKFLVIDDRTVIISSANLTFSDTHGDWSKPETIGNANHLLKINSPELARVFTQEFNWMWRDRKFGLQKPYRPPVSVRVGNSIVTVQFSPTSRRLAWSQSVSGLIGRTLNQATRSVDMALFVFSEQNLANILEARHRRGVKVRSLVEPSFAYRDYSELLDLLGVALPNNRCQVEANNQPWSSPIATAGTPNLTEGDLLHHKFGLIDDRLVITGSQNWSDAANLLNDENLLVIQNPIVAAHFRREFDRLYQTATLGVPDWLQTKIQQGCR